MLGLQQAAAFGKRPAGVLATVPFVRADGGKEMLIDAYCARFHEMMPGPIAGSVEILAELKTEHDDIAGRLRHRSLYPPIFSGSINTLRSRSQSRGGLG
jgi:hypothetical protein